MVRPDPIPNSAVKRSVADGSGLKDSARVGSRHSFKKAETSVSAFSFYSSCLRFVWRIIVCLCIGVGLLMLVTAGRVAEWLKAPDSKSGLGAILTGVRIPPLPPYSSITPNQLGAHSPNTLLAGVASGLTSDDRVTALLIHSYQQPSVARTVGTTSGLCVTAAATGRFRNLFVSF